MKTKAVEALDVAPASGTFPSDEGCLTPLKGFLREFIVDSGGKGSELS